jgi:hypothetical protein
MKHQRFGGADRICVLTLDHAEKGPLGTLDFYFVAANAICVLLKVLRLSVN